MALYSPPKPTYESTTVTDSSSVGVDAIQLKAVIYRAGSHINISKQAQSISLSSSKDREKKHTYFLEESITPKRLVSGGFSITYDRLVALFQEQDEDEPKPTSYAFETAEKLLLEAVQFLPFDFPKAVVSADEEGGIRFRWRASTPGHEIRLYCPPTRNMKVYIYHEAEDAYGSEYAVSGQSLAEWLTLLMRREIK